MPEVANDTACASAAAEALGAKPGYQITEYSVTAAALAHLSSKYGGVLFDVNTKDGFELAKSARSELRGYRTNLENIRKQIKAPALEKCRLIDAEAKEITEKLTAIEDPIAAQIEREQERQEAEKQAKLKAEIARVNALRVRITDIGNLAVISANATSAYCESVIVKAKAVEIGDDFAEFKEEAQRVKESALFRLQGFLIEAMNREAAADQIRKDREELDRMRAEADQRRRDEAAEAERIAAERRAQIDAEDKARRIAQENEDVERAAKIAEEERLRSQERARQDADAQAEREAIAEAQRRIREEQDRIAAEKRAAEEKAQAEIRAQEEAERAAKAAEEAAARAADEKLHGAAHTMLAALTAGKIALQKRFDTPPDDMAASHAADEGLAVAFGFICEAIEAAS